MRTNSTTGFTVIELLLVLALVGIVSAFGLAMSLSSVARSSVQTERDLFVTLLLRGARAEAIANAGEEPRGIYIDNQNHRYILFSGSSYSNNNATNRAIPYTDDSLSISNTGGDTIIFEQLSGNVTTGAGTISVTNGVATQTININTVGQIDW